MVRPPSNFAASTSALLQNVADLPPESESPLQHYRRAANDVVALIEYFRRKVSQTDHYPASFERHLARLRGMALERLLAAFERFLKEIAAICIQHLAGFVLDGRLDKFSTTGSAVVQHFESGTIGRALSESDTWLNCRTINQRFKKLLSDPFDAGTPFWLFPAQNQSPSAEAWRLPIMATLFQVRHTLAHNLGVLTGSDAARLRQLSRTDVPSNKVLSPSRTDFRHVKRFIDETAVSINERVASRLEELLTTLDADGYLAFDAEETAQALANAFQLTVTVSGTTKSPPPAT